MEDEIIINGINYCLDDENLTAEVIKSYRRYEGGIEIPETVKVNDVSYRVTSIGMYAFLECDSLTSIVIPNSITSIRKGAFESCRNLTSITIPDSVTSIGEKAFEFCSSLISIVIPDGVTSIGGRAFSGCSSLSSIVIPKSIKSISDDAFVGCSSLTSIVVVDGNTVYDSREKCNAIIETGTNTLIRGCQISIIPNGITSIGKNAFGICNTLISIIIPDGVTSIEAEAFRYCESLKSITIPDSVTSIEWWAFCGCKSLTDITFQGTIAQWKKITLRDSWKHNIPATVVHCTDGDVEI